MAIFAKIQYIRLMQKWRLPIPGGYLPAGRQVSSAKSGFRYDRSVLWVLSSYFVPSYCYRGSSGGVGSRDEQGFSFRVVVYTEGLLEVRRILD